MNIGFKNFAIAGTGNVRINDLTVIFGPNNTGKTYINYAICSILLEFVELVDFKVSNKELTEFVSDLKSTGTAKLDLSRFVTKLKKMKSSDLPIIGSKIHEYFQISEEFFCDTKFTVRLDELNLDKLNSSYSGNYLIGNSTPISYEFNYKREFLRISIENFGKASDSSQGELHSDDKANETMWKYFLTTLMYIVHVADIIPRPYAITSERTGISLFYKIFDYRNNEILKIADRSMKSGSNSTETLTALRSQHALPIEENINNVRFYGNLTKKPSFLAKNRKVFNEINGMLSELLGDCTFVSKNDALYFKIMPKSGRGELTIPFHATSSSVKSLFFLDLFVKNMAQANNILIIDEPELNLSVENQVLMARLLAKIVNAGIKVLVTTHSEYFVREINNLIALGSVDRKKRSEIMRKFAFQESDLLQISQVSAYRTHEDRDVEEIKVFRSGIDSDFWNDSIYKANKKSEEIHYALELD